MSLAKRWARGASINLKVYIKLRIALFNFGKIALQLDWLRDLYRCNRINPKSCFYSKVGLFSEYFGLKYHKHILGNVKNM